jgi:hypothetical protein
LISLNSIPTFAQKSQLIALECKSQSATWFFTIEDEKLTITDNYQSTYNPMIKDSKYVLSSDHLAINWTDTKKYFDSHQYYDTKYKFKVNRFNQKFSIEINWKNSPKDLYEGECVNFTEKKF